MSDQSERLHLEGLDEATERERWEEHHAVEAAALTEQERERIDKACWQGVALPQLFTAVESILAARLADSRPVVSEAAIEAATDALLVGMWVKADSRSDLEMAVHVALTAALPHMGDGRGDDA